MSFYELLIDNLFVGESVKDISTVIYSLNKNISVFNIYLICYNEIKNNIEILSSNEFIKKRNENKNILSNPSVFTQSFFFYAT